MPLPARIARLNKRYTNRLIEPLARRRTGFAVVHHVGRRSGTTYSTPVNAFRSDSAGHESVIVALTYGPSADWIRNVLAGPADIEIGRRIQPITAVEIVDRAVSWPALPRPVRLVLRLLRVTDFARLSLAPPSPRASPSNTVRPAD